MCKSSKPEYMRRLLNRCVPREAPPIDYTGTMNELRLVQEDLDVIAHIAAATGLMDEVALRQELKRLRATAEKMRLAVVGYYDEDE